MPHCTIGYQRQSTQSNPLILWKIVLFYSGCAVFVYKSVPVFSIPAFTECLNAAARNKTLLHDTDGTSDYMDPGWPAGQGQEEPN